MENNESNFISGFLNSKTLKFFLKYQLNFNLNIRIK